MPWRSGSPHGVFSAGDGTEVPGETADIWANAGTTCIAALTARAAAAVIGLDQRFRMMTSSACYRLVIVRVLMRQGTRNAGQWSKARLGICGAGWKPIVASC